MRLMPEDALAGALTRAVRAGDLAALRRLLDAQPELATAEIQREATTLTALHLTADWPGYFPGAPEAVRILIGAGADPDASTGGGETALRWVACTDDVDVAEALVDGGADVEAGAPLEDAVGYGSWHTARFLVARGARIGPLWLAAALGATDRVEELLAGGPAPDELDEALWQACHGGQLRTAARLVAAGADPAGRPGYAQDPSVAIATRPENRRAALAAWLSGLGGPP